MNILLRTHTHTHTHTQAHTRTHIKGTILISAFRCQKLECSFSCLTNINLFMRIYVCVFVGMCVCVCVFYAIWLHSCLAILRIGTLVHLRACTRARVCVYVRARVCVCVCLAFLYSAPCWIKNGTLHAAIQRLRPCDNCWFISLFPACDKGHYKWHTGSEACRVCPAYSEAHEPGAVECRCQAGYYRSLQDDKAMPCTSE